MTHPCTQCGICCRLFPVGLNKAEYQSGRYRTELEGHGFAGTFAEAKSCGATLLKRKKDGSCFYLKSNRCSIHAYRPSVCRPFFCTSKAKRFRGMIVEINNYRPVTTRK